MEYKEPFKAIYEAKAFQEKRAKLDANIDNILSQIKAMIKEK